MTSVTFDFELTFRPNIYLSYTCDMVKHYSYFHIKIKINKNLSLPMPSFAELDVEDIPCFCLGNLLSLHGSKSNV